MSSEIIQKVAQSEHNKDVYMFAFDINELYGTVLIAVNTESLIEKTITERYQDSKKSDIEGVRGIRYNTGECEEFYYYLGEHSKKLQQMIDIYENCIHEMDYEGEKCEEAQTQFISSVVNVLNTLKPNFEKLNTTDKFICYAMTHEGEEEDIIELVQRTNSAEKMDEVFPEINAFKNHCATLKATLTPQEHASYWINAYLDILGNKETEQTLFLQNDMLLWSTDMGGILAGVEKHINDKLVTEAFEELERLKDSLGFAIYDSDSELVEIVRNRKTSKIEDIQSLINTLKQLTSQIKEHITDG